jgi:aminotransferase
MIHVSRPSLGIAELEAVRRVMESAWIGKGPVTRRFEEEFSTHIGAASPDHVVSVSSCSEALFAVVESLNLKAGDEVVVPDICFVSAANAVKAAGASLVLCDVDAKTVMATPETIEARVTPRTKAVILVHYGGMAADVKTIAPMLKRRGVILIEDAATAVATKVGGVPVGTFGDYGVWSFDGAKLVTAGDGGMVWARDPQAARSLRERTYLGEIGRHGYAASQESDSRWWEFQQSCFGRRSIMNDMSSAIGLVQLGRVKEFVARRKKIWETYDREFGRYPAIERPPAPSADVQHSFYQYWIRVPSGRDFLAYHLKSCGIYVNFRYHPIHRIEMFGEKGAFPGSDDAADRTLCLPLYQDMSATDVGNVVRCTTAFFGSGDEARALFKNKTPENPHGEAR